MLPIEKELEPPMHMESVLLDQQNITELLATYGDMEVRTCDSVLLIPPGNFSLAVSDVKHGLCDAR